jgi:hypothetical protein
MIRRLGLANALNALQRARKKSTPGVGQDAILVFTRIFYAFRASVLRRGATV